MIFTFALLLIHAQPYDDHELRELLLPEGCPMPCFMGIRPGVTTGDEALKLLRASKWVEGISGRSSELGIITWQWSNQNPLNWTKGRSAAFSITYGHVDNIILNTGFRLGEIRLILGVPDSEFVNVDINQTGKYANYGGSYYQYGLVILGSQSCNALQPLLQVVIITIGRVADSSTNASHSFGNSLYNMPHVC
jgi:hypothetical protein